MEMGELDGIETANHIRQTDRYVIIVFVTSHKKYMLRSFECMPFRFLIKPIKFKDFYKVYNEICIKLKDKPETVVFTENRSRTRVFCDDIIFFESCAHSILIHTRDGKVHKIRKTMIELLETIDKSTFVRVHRAFAVDYDGKLPQLDDFILGIEKESILHDKNSGLYFFGSLMKINHIILKGTKRFCRI